MTTTEKKLTGPEQRLFLRLRSEQLRAEAIAATGDPQARASQAPGMKGQVMDQLPGGPHAAEGKKTVDLLLGKHVARAKNDPQKPAGQTDRIARANEKKSRNVNLNERTALERT